MGRQNSFDIKGKIIKSSALTYKNLVFLCDQFYNKNKHLVRRDFKKENNLPSIDVLYKILHQEGISYNSFVDRYKNPRNRKRMYNPDLFNIYVDRYKSISKNLTRPLSMRDLYKNNLPSSKWFIKYCPDQTVQTWLDFERWCGFDTINKRDEMANSKHFVMDELRKLEKNLGRPVLIRDITRKNIGFSWQVIYDIWGGFEQCKQEAGLMINTKGTDPKSWDYCDTMMTTALNNIFKITNNNIFTWQDFLDYKNVPLAKDTFVNACLRQNIDLYDYFKSKGFDFITNSGTGYVTRFDDGEICKSSYEYKYSSFLRKNNISYQRNIKYKTLEPNLVNTNIDCDYKLSNGTWVEICGMIRATEADWKTKQITNKISFDYRERMFEKEEILKSMNVPFLFLFQKDFDDDSYIAKTMRIL